MNEVVSLRPNNEPTPLNIEAEQAVIGQLLLHPDLIGKAVARGGAGLFGDPVHAEIFNLMAQRHREGRLVSPVALREAAVAMPGLDQLGGPAYLARMAGAAISAVSLPAYLDMLADLSRKRSLIAAMSEAMASIARGEDAADTIAGRLEASMLASTPMGSQSGPVSMLKAVGVALEQVSAAYRGEDDSVVKSGIHALDTMIGGFYPGELILVGGRPSMGKAQPMSAPILMRDGSWGMMADMAIGDELASIDGAPSFVTGIFPQGDRQVYRVKFSDGRTTRCCAEHLWQIESSKFDGQKVVSTAEIARMISTERYRRRVYVPLISGDFGSDADLPIDPWLLGALLGNGSMSSSGVSLHDPHAETINRVRAALPDGVRAKHYSVIEYGISTKRGQPNPVLDALDKLGLRGCKSEQKFIPACYMKASRASRLRLLNGLMDTDGWVETFGAVRYSTSSRRLAGDIQRLVRSIGGLCAISKKVPVYEYLGEKKEGLDHFVLNIRHGDPASLVSLTKKRDRCVRNKPVRLTIVSIEPDGIEPTQCIAVSHPSHLYVTDDYIVTHNTGVALSIALNAARAGHGVCIASLEMNPEAMAIRALSEATAQTRTAVSYAAMRRGEMTEQQVTALRHCAQSVADLPITFLPRSYSDIGALFAGAKQAQRSMEGGLKLFVVDYAQLLRSRASSRYEQITEISIALKELSGQLNVPVIALSQLSRQVETREDKRPMLSDLRESGQLEQDADAVLFCYRDEYYVERMRPQEGADISEQAEWQAAMERSRNRLEIIVAKQRQGAIGTANVRFNPAINLIWEDR